MVRNEDEGGQAVGSWCDHVMRRDQKYVGRRVMEMELPEKRKAEEKIFRFSE